MFTVVVPGDASDAFNTTSNVTCVATQSSALNLLDLSWVLITWLDVLHALCFGVMVVFVLFTFLML